MPKAGDFFECLVCQGRHEVTKLDVAIANFLDKEVRSILSADNNVFGQGKTTPVSESSSENE